MNNITERAMLVALNISQWGARKHDKKASEDVAKLNGSDVQMGRYTKDLVDKESLRNIQLIARAAREHHMFNTLPWTDAGFRILPGAAYFDYVSEQRRYRAKYNAAVREFTAQYEDCVRKARARLQGLFSFSDYPSHDEIAGKFQMECAFSPMPSGNDFRVTLGDEEVARLRAEIEQRVRSATEDAMSDLWTRVHEAVARMSRNLNNYNVDPVSGKVQHPFRDSMVENLRALAEVLPKLNVTGDPHLETMRTRLVEALCPHEAQDLRDSTDLRKSVAGEADDILAEMAAYVGEDIAKGRAA